MTTVKDVLIHDALENHKKYKEEKKKEKELNKVQVKIQKSRDKNKVSPLAKVWKQRKTVSKGINTSKRKIKTKTRSQLVKELDAIFSKYIRLNNIDCNWLCKCVTCGAKVHRKNIQNGHFITRGNYKYRWDENNCFPQCMPCNIYKSWNYIAYTLFMIWKYGQDKVKEMQEDKELIKISTVEIRDMIDFYTAEVDSILDNIQKYQDSCVV